MICPRCGSDRLQVQDSRKTDTRKNPNAIRRRRKCEECHLLFTTYECAPVWYNKGRR